MAPSSKDPAVLRDKIMNAIQVNDRATALSLGQRMVKLPAASAQDCMAVAELGQRFADSKTTLAGLQAAHKRAPSNLRLLLDFIDIELGLGFTKEAHKHMETAEKLCRTYVDYDELGNKYGQLSEVEKAHEAFTKAHKMAPNEIRVISNLAVSYGFLGEIDKAEALYDEAIAKGSTDDFIFLNRSWLRRQSPESNHIPELLKVVENAPGKEQISPLLLYALGKEYEDVGQNKEAFDTIEKAATAKRRQIEYTEDDLAKEIDAAITIYSTQFIQESARKACLSEEPIFVVGMPRSGTTLVEHIIGAHSSVFAAGELQNLGWVSQVKMTEAIYANEMRTSDPVEVMDKVQMKDLGKAYIASTRPRTGHRPYFTDKLPTNFFSCGLVACALPNAKIVHVMRDPMDTCFAMYKQHFNEGHFASYDQKELGDYYLAYRKIMAHWEKVMPGKIIHVRYEDLVADTETTTRDLIERLGLEWEEACLDHTANPRASMTASAAQIRQPIYQSSVGKWRQFEDRLGVLKATLEAGGIDVG